MTYFQEAQPYYDFHTTLLWLRSIEIRIGHSPALLLYELDQNELFARYRSPVKA